MADTLLANMTEATSITATSKLYTEVAGAERQIVGSNLATSIFTLAGVTASVAELNLLDGVTATTAELNILDGVTATAAELNFVDGVTSAIQTQLDAKAANAATHTIWVPAAAMVQRSTSGAALGTAETTTNKVMLKTLDFDASTDEFAQFTVRMPKSWNESTVTAEFVWSSTVASGDVVWGVQGLSLSDSDVIDAAFGTAVTVTDSQGTAGDLMKSAATTAMTIAGTPTEGDAVIFQVYRDADAAGDTLAGDARLHGVCIFYTVTVGTDA